jgi:hypothetical protein
VLGRDPQRRNLAAALLTIPLLALVGCGTDEGSDEAAAPSPETEPAPASEPTPEAVITPAPSPTAPAAEDAEDPGILGFSAPTLEGGEFDASVLAGQQLAIWFWAPW